MVGVSNVLFRYTYRIGQINVRKRCTNEVICKLSLNRTQFSPKLTSAIISISLDSPIAIGLGQGLGLCQRWFSSWTVSHLGVYNNSYGSACVVSNLTLLNFHCDFETSLNKFQTKWGPQIQQVRTASKRKTRASLHYINRPNPHEYNKAGIRLRYKVHYPEDGEYTIQPLPMTKLGGRDPETGRIIMRQIGGGHKRKFRWVIKDRVPEGYEDPYIERVLHIQYDPNNSGLIALVGNGINLRYILASSTMAAGDLITSTRHIPNMPVKPKEGDAHPLGALPIGTEVCCIEQFPGEGAMFKVQAGGFGSVLRRYSGKVLVHMNKYQNFVFDEKCLATVGHVSTRSKPIRPFGSAQRHRWFGVTPSSGLWQSKKGRSGFKRKTLKVVEIKRPEEPLRVYELTLKSEQPRKKVIPRTEGLI